MQSISYPNLRANREETKAASLTASAAKTVNYLESVGGRRAVSVQIHDPKCMQVFSSVQYGSVDFNFFKESMLSEIFCLLSLFCLK